MLFREHIREIESNILKHIDTNVRLYFKLTPEQTRNMTIRDKKILYVDILYHKKHNEMDKK